MKTIVVALLCCISPAGLYGQFLSVASPDANLLFTFFVEDAEEEQGCLFYSLSHRDKNVVRKSRLGIVTVDLPSWINGFTLVDHTQQSIDETWKPVYGERSTVRNRYNECTINLRKDNDKNNTFQVIIRVYNEGAAFCYSFPENLSTSVIHIKDEITQFVFEDGTIAYVTPFAQELYYAQPLQDWSYESTLPLPRWAPRTPDYESERPLALVLPNDLFAVIGEARLVDYSRMKFILSPEKTNTVGVRLFGPVTESSPFTTPWRVIMVAERPGDLIEHNDIFLNLNPPCEIEDTRWIKPGKVMREITLSTAGAEECLEFCVEHNIQYIEFDAGWYGYEYSKASDASEVDVDPRRNPKKDLDLQKIIASASEKNVGVILYVNHRALEQQIDEILPVYRQWGVAGLKFGFVHVGSHKWTSWVHEAVRKAARYQLMVDIHDEYRPTGFSRTYPNLMTQEGIYGNECMPEANHNTIVPFTRFLAGAADYTICYYHQAGIKDVKGIKTTSAHQMALSVIYYSPLQFVFWYDRPSDYQGEPEIEFFERLPTVWDTTTVLLGDIGNYIAIARRSGETWFLGAITNNEGRVLDMPLGFLDKGKDYTASLYTDGGEAIPTRTHVGIERLIVGSTSVVRAHLNPSGGMAMEIRPATENETRLHKRHQNLE
ncbi:MAG: glycoside hydrolase family 97 catalytic domain-containing protein [Bacteroidota bacterium]